MSIDDPGEGAGSGGNAGADRSGGADANGDAGNTARGAAEGDRRGAQDPAATPRLARRLDPSRIDVPRALLVALVLAVVVGLGAAAATSSASFGSFNPGWDGGSDFRGTIDDDPDTDLVHVTDAERYEAIEANGTVAIVVSPEESYGPADVRGVRGFVERGGTLVVFENFGDAGNRLLAGVGAESRVDGRLLRDETNYFRGPAMPVAAGVEDHALTDGVDRLTLNYATAVDPGANATVLVRTSEVAALTEPGTGPDEGGEVGAHPVAAVETVGQGAPPWNASNATASGNVTDGAENATDGAGTGAAGAVVVVGDPSVTINAMYDEPDNAAFLDALTADADRVVFDHSHARSLPPLSAALIAVRDSPLLGMTLGFVALGAIAAVASGRVGRGAGRLLDGVARTGPGAWLFPERARRVRGPRSPASADAPARGGRDPPASDGRDQPVGDVRDPTLGPDPGLSDEQRAAAIRRRYPEWDEDRVRRVIGALNRTRSQGGDE